jgi:hypothetical protein
MRRCSAKRKNIGRKNLGEFSVYEQKILCFRQFNLKQSLKVCNMSGNKITLVGKLQKK